VENGDGVLVVVRQEPFHVEQHSLPVPFHVKLDPARLTPGSTDPRETPHVTSQAARRQRN